MAGSSRWCTGARRGTHHFVSLFTLEIGQDIVVLINVQVEEQLRRKHPVALRTDVGVVAFVVAGQCAVGVKVRRVRR